jgi:hypothetical protein
MVGVGARARVKVRVRGRVRVTCARMASLAPSDIIINIKEKAA